MGRIRHAPLSPAAAVAVGVCLIALAGCGGGGDDNSTAATQGVAQVTTPGRFNPGTRSTPAPPQSQDRTSTTPPASGNGPPGAGQVEQPLAPFRDCLSRHGVDPAEFRPGLLGWRQRQRDPAEIQKQIQAGIACIPELPTRMRKTAERMKRRYEQRKPGA